MFRVNLPNFSKGELGPELVARTDVAAYGAAAKRARNVIIRKYGGLTKRMGTRFVSEVYDSSQPVRLIPFQFSIEQAYALEFGQGYMRAAALGGMVLNEELVITGITKASNATVTAALHGYAVGDQVYFRGVNGMVEINGRTARVVSVGGANTFTIDLDTSGFGVFTSADGGIVRTAPPPTPTPPPVVPPVVDPPPPPSTGGGGGGGGGTGCPADDEYWLLANDDRTGPGREVMGADLDPARDWVWTEHEKTGVWGAYRIASIEYVEALVMEAIDLPQALRGTPVRPLRATPDHPMKAPGLGKPWFKMAMVGEPDGRARVVKAVIEGAHTMVVNGVLSHNKLSQPREL